MEKDERCGWIQPTSPCPPVKQAVIPIQRCWGLGNAMSFNILLRSFLGLGSRLSGVSAQNEWLQLWGLCESVIAISNLSQMKNSVWFLGILFVKLLRLMSTVA